MEALLPWILAAVVLVALIAILLAWRLPRRRSQQPQPLPTEWALAPRPVFSTDERRVYRQLREALPHHIVLSKLPLVRFCQPSDPNDVRYWYELLGSIHVTFAICSANGRVLAAIDLDTDRGNSRRITQIKQSVLGACRVRYLRCPVDNLPSIAELQLLVPQATAASRGPQPAPSRPQPRTDASAEAGPTRRRRERATLWLDSSFFQDSFFAPDNRLDVSVPGDLGGIDPRQASRSLAPTEPREGSGDPDSTLGDGEPERLPGTGTHN
ncbi:MAG TPA: DUF2726 domain-containing protein [Burkholderiaceae bacterium]|nr:DUF2726 domain-containing protein [Burkholderiaceae bacterium]